MAMVPGLPTVTKLGVTTATLTWAASDNPSAVGSTLLGYTFQYALDLEYTQGVRTFDRNERNISLTGLSSGTSYYCRVRARYRNTDGSLSNTVWRQTRYFKTIGVPTMAASPNASSITRNSARLTGFSVSSNGGQAPSNLRVQYNTSSSTSGASVKTQGSWAATTLSGLAADTRYYYRAAAYNSAGWGPYNAWKSFRTLADAPSDMAPPTFSDVDELFFRVHWTAPEMHGATFSHYRLEVATDEEFSSIIRNITTTTSFTDLVENLTPGTEYWVRVRAEASPNHSGWGTASVRTAGGGQVEDESRIYAFISGVRRQGSLYTFVDGTRRRLRPMYQHDGIMETI